MSLQKCPYFRFNSANKQWDSVEWHKVPITDETLDYFDHLKIATFNVLFDLYDNVEHIIQSEKRFAHHFTHTLPNANADILVLQEVTTPYLGKLLKQQWVEEKYIFCTMYSDRLEKNADDKLKNWVVILSKIPMKENYNFFVGDKACYRAVPVVTFDYPGTNIEFAVCGVHLKAKFAFDKERQLQIDHLMQGFGRNERTSAHFQSLFKRQEEYNSNIIAEPKKTKGGKLLQPPAKRKPTWKEFDNVIVLGDFNMQRDHEEDFIPSDVVDVWKCLRPDEIGFTNDPFTNAMNRRMGEMKDKVPPPLRLDRVLLLPRNKHHTEETEMIWDPKHISLFATEVIPDTDELYASDHYGVMTHLSIKR